MKIRHALLLLVAPLLLAACSQQPEPAAAADAPAPSAQTDAPPATPANAAAPAASTANDTAAAPAGPIRAPEGPAPQAGTDYVAIDGGQAFAQTAGKIEVAEVFAYWCGHCAAFEPLVNAWKAKLPADVNFVAVPAVFNEGDNYPRAYYAAQTMGVLAQTHEATFNAIHLQRKLPPNASADAIADFYATLGVDGTQFRSTMQSFAVNASLGRARQFAVRSGIEATPTLVVNGKYRVIGGRSLEDTLRIADHLVAMERAAQ